MMHYLKGIAFLISGYFEDVALRIADRVGPAPPPMTFEDAAIALSRCRARLTYDDYGYPVWDVEVSPELWGAFQSSVNKRGKE